jgi:hypothetical protein
VRGAKLLLQAEYEITKAIGERGASVVVIEVIGDSDAKLRLAGDAEPYGGFREVVAAPASVRGLLEAVLKLQAAAGDNNAGVGDLRTVWAFAECTAVASRSNNRGDEREGMEKIIAPRYFVIAKLAAS